VLKHQETDNRGSFEACGIGLNYIYDANSKVLDIIDARGNKPLIYIDFDTHLSKNSLEFVRLFEKTTQIRAIMLSNNQTIDLSETLDESRLCAILTTVASTARYCFDIESQKFKRFAKYFCNEYQVRSIEIGKIAGYDPESAYFYSRLTTQHSNTAEARAASIPALLSSLSEHVIQDLLTKEFGYNLQAGAHSLLRVSHKLSVISCILNDSFVPANKLVERKKQPHEMRA
jgi:hypothetical protein